MNVSTTRRKKNLHYRPSEERQKLIREVRDKLVRYYKPEKVILFGSQAYGRPRRDSDLDLLIIKRTRKDFFERIREVSRLFPLRDFALDVIVRTPSELRARLTWGDFFYKEIVTRGRILYEKQ
jgi:predicted nucleotidyltransferase